MRGHDERAERAEGYRDTAAANVSTAASLLHSAMSAPPDSPTAARDIVIAEARLRAADTLTTLARDEDPDR